MEFIHISHSVYFCDYHIVLATKYREEILNEGIFAYFDKKLAEITEHYPLIQFKQVNHDRDHIHLLLNVIRSQLSGIFNVTFSRGPLSKDGMIANNMIIPSIRQA